MIARLLTLAALVAFTAHDPERGVLLLGAFALGAWTAAGIGYRTAVRTNGASMIRAGSHRLLSGRF